ncbi:DNA translocase FtsK [Neobacillus jeddahensis]|uniref:DNA translocase FtsK n=1 Tax=Neobacillus jeddahensis TaxID=1461580 RepID=UPI00058DD136|nr:DNA translocase FtsK [Neobacillus jeddahensis]
MSWIQNFFQKLKKEEEGDVNDYPFQSQQQDKLAPLNQYESLKDLDARISYQYPKGSNPSSRPQKSIQKSIQEELGRPKRSEKLLEKRTISTRQAKPEVKKEVPKIKAETSSRPRGPFQPTEIPSPVYGFNRPRRSDTIVEHELSHFLSEELDQKLNESISIEKTLTRSTAEVPTDNENLVLNAEGNTTVIGSEDIDLEVSLATQALETILETATSMAVEEIQVEPLSLEIVGENESEIQFELEVEEIEEQEQEETLMSESSLEPDREIESVPVQETEQPVPTRSRLPFNVMMLKQDKQKWEEKKRKSEFGQQLGLQAENKQEEIMKVNVALEQNPIVEEVEVEVEGTYILPKSNLLSPPVTEILDTEWIDGQKELLNVTLQNFNVGASVVNVTQGPSVTRFEVQPEPGVKVNKITNLSDDIKLSLAARDIRIEAPIPGKHTIGIEVPNQKSRPVLINEIIGSPIFTESESPLTAVLGLDIAGKPIVTDLKKMPHGLIAGATGSGKSVCINSILISLLYKARPEDLKLLLIDPKMVELAPYNRIPHLVSPVITDVKAATAALKWAVDEMERRYELFAHAGVRDINRFNDLAMQHKRYSDKLPFIVIIIDELADLMMMSPADVEEAICRIAQKARACGIHLIVATQRPSVDVITGLIKANIPTRVAFSVSSQVDSRTIIDISGAEKLLGRGDMLFLENGSSKPVRLQGTFVSDEEIDLVVDHVRQQREPEYLFEQEELLKKAQVIEDEDELFYEACEFIIDHGGASTSSLQRRFKIGYNRAARLMDMLEQNGYISSANGSKPREVLITEADLQSIQD